MFTGERVCRTKYEYTPILSDEMKSVTKLLSSVTIISKVFSNWRPVCIPKIISWISNKIRYFRKDMLFNYCI